MTFQSRSLIILFTIILYLVSGANGEIKIGILTADGSGSSGYTESLGVENHCQIRESVLLAGSSLRKSFAGSGSRSDKFSITNAFGDHAEVGFEILNSTGYYGDYSISPNNFDYARADMSLNARDADSIRAFADARSRDGVTNSGSSTLIDKGSLVGYRNSAYSTLGFAKAEQTADFAQGDRVAFYGGSWNGEGHSLQFQTLTNESVGGYRNSVRTTPTTEYGTQHSDIVNGDWYIQECALDYTGNGAGNSAGSFWWGSGSIKNYNGNSKATLTQKSASSGADRIKGDSIQGTNSYIDFNQPEKQLALVTLRTMNGDLKGFSSSAKVTDTFLSRSAESSQEFDSVARLNSAETLSFDLSARARTEYNSPKEEKLNLINNKNIYSGMKVTARSTLWNAKIYFASPRDRQM